MDRKAFNSCVSAGLSGKHFTPEQRKMEFCIIAKKCAKNLPREEAQRICSLPKPPKPEGTKKRRSKQAECPEFDTSTLIPRCESQLAKMVKLGELSTSTDVTGICNLILG